jgi:hypothetical protein
MLVLVPVYKIFLLNPLLRDITHVFINQVSQPLRFTTLQNTQIWTELVKDVRTKHKDFLEELTFMGFYPSSPHYRTLGVQIAQQGGMTMLVWAKNTMHLHTHRKNRNTGLPLTGVHLDALNLYHFACGYVEVNITQKNQLEHPMWLIGDVTSRSSNNQLRSINKTFAIVYSKVIVYFTSQFRACRAS